MPGALTSPIKLDSLELRPSTDGEYYLVGALVYDVFVQLAAIKCGQIDDEIAEAQKAAQTQPAQTEQPTQPTQPAPPAPSAAIVPPAQSAPPAPPAPPQ